MAGRRKRWGLVALLVLVAVGALVAAAQLPYLPLIHGSRADEVERLAGWLALKPGMHVADVGAGGGKFALAVAQRVGDSGLVYATELNAERLAEIGQAVSQAGLTNVKVIPGMVSGTNLPEACCDALFTRHVYHHLSDAAAINTDIHRALRPGGRLLIIDFEPLGLMSWFSRPDTTERHGGHGTPKATVLKDVSAAGFQLVRGPEPWRGRTYAVLFARP
jgi:ubiquinone/menaquinone biosynthesis C-methylase UbiE